MIDEEMEWKATTYNKRVLYMYAPISACWVAKNKYGEVHCFDRKPQRASEDWTFPSYMGRSESVGHVFNLGIGRFLMSVEWRQSRRRLRKIKKADIS